MTFKEAEDKLEKIAKGGYRFIGYQKTMDEQRIVEVKCQIYLASEKSIYSGVTWEAAFDKRERIVNPTSISTEGQPE